MTDPDHHRPIRSYVLREGRLTRGQERAFGELWPRFGVDWAPGTVLDLPILFGDARPVVLEIGFGNGETLAELAARHPERGYLGIEVHRPGVGHLLLQLEKRALTNVRVLRHDAIEVLTHGLAPASLAGVYLFFPDPWPKTRHHKRRILSGGLFHAATDWGPYAAQMLAVLGDAADLFENAAGPGAYAPRPEDRPLTRFERRGQRLGHEVWDLVFHRR